MGIHLGVRSGLLKAARRARQIGATAIQIFSDNPTAWRRRAAPPAKAEEFIGYTAEHHINPIVIHASYLINLAGTAEPFAAQSREGLAHELRWASAYGARLVNTHVGSHRGMGHQAGIRRVVDTVSEVLAEAPDDVTLVLENSSGGGDTIGARLEDLTAILEAVPATVSGRLAFCLDTAHLWGAGYDIGSADGARAIVDEFARLVGIERLVLVHLNDSRSELGSRNDRHEHVGAGRIGPEGLGAILRDPRLKNATFIMETPGADDGYDAVNMRRALLMYGGATSLPLLPPKAFRLTRRSTRSGPRQDQEVRAPTV